VEPCHLGVAGGFQHGLGPEHVGPEEPARVEHRQAVVGLRREVDHRVDLVLPQGVEGQVTVAHVAVDEADPLLDVDQVGPVPGVREGVVGHHGVPGVLLHPVPDEIGADEACTPGDEHVHGASIVDRATQDAREEDEDGLKDVGIP